MVTAKVNPRGVAPPWPVTKTRQRPERQGNRKQRGRFRERGDVVNCCKGAERGQPKRAVSGPGAKPDRRDVAGKIGQQQATGQAQHNLRIDGRSIVLHSEEPETESQKQRIAGQADQRGIEFATGRGESIAAVQQQVFCDVAIDQGVAVGRKQPAQHPQAQGQARGEGGEGRQAESLAGEKAGCGFGLTLACGFHTIRTV